MDISILCYIFPQSPNKKSPGTLPQWTFIPGKPDFQSMLVVFVSYAILLQDFFCHPTEMWLYPLDNFYLPLQK